MKILISLSKVPMKIVRPYMANFNRTRYATIFNKYGSNGGNGKANVKDKFRIYIPITGSPLKPDTLQAPKELVEHLESMGMRVNDYRSGTALLPDGKRVVRIGKVIKDLEVKKIYDQDPQRATTKSVPAWVVISRHPYDIVGMSFDRGWSSCMNAEDGQYKEHLVAEVKEGSLVAYLLKADDRNINRPMARIAIKPYDSVSGKRILVPSKTYGVANKSFTQTVYKFCQWASSGSPKGTYTLSKGCYDDLSQDTIYHLHSVDDLKGLNSKAKRMVAGNPNTPAEVLAFLAKDKDYDVRRKVASNPNTPAEALTLLAKDEYVRGEVAANPNTPAEALTLLAKDDWYGVRRKVAENPNTPAEALTLLAKDKDEYVRLRVSGNPSTPAEVLKAIRRS